MPCSVMIFALDLFAGVRGVAYCGRVCLLVERQWLQPDDHHNADAVRIAALCILAGALLTTAEPPARPPQGGVALGPAMALALDIPAGVDVDASAERRLLYTLGNRGGEALPVTLHALPPAAAGVSTWELGYEPLPDPGWVQLAPSALVLPPGSEVKSHVVLHVPAGSTWLNRRFVACVTLRPGTQPGVGAGLALAARLLIETTTSSSADAGADAPLATVPSRVGLDLPPGGAGSATVLVRRRGRSDPTTVQWRHLATLEGDAVRRLRYRTPFTIEDATIATPGAAELHAEAGAWMPMTITLHAPADAVPGSRYEDILVIGTAADLELAADPRRTMQPTLALIRCQVQVLAEAVPSSAPPPTP